MNSTITDTAIIFKALGDETRLKIIKIIASKGNKLCVGAIAQCLEVSQPAVSQHLKILKNAGIVAAERQGFHIHYSLVLDSLSPLDIDFKELLESFGAEFDLSVHCSYKGNSEKCNELGE